MEAMESPGTGDTDTMSSHVGAGAEPQFYGKETSTQPLSHFSSPEVRILIPSQICILNFSPPRSLNFILPSVRATK